MTPRASRERRGRALHDRPPRAGSDHDPNFVPAATAWNTPTPSVDLVPVEAFCRPPRSPTRAARTARGRLGPRRRAALIPPGGQRHVRPRASSRCARAARRRGAGPAAQVLAPLAARTWQMWELDILLQAPAVANGTLDGAGAVALRTFRRADRRHRPRRRPATRVLLEISTRRASGHRAADGSRTTSLYARLFLDPAVPADAGSGRDRRSAARSPTPT